ncbi:hypothetical protein ACN3XK_03650 [Actinomadura welshii]
MNEEWQVASNCMIRVVVADREVVETVVQATPSRGGCGLDLGAGAGEEPHAGLQVDSLYPGVDIVGDSEGMVVDGDENPAVLALGLGRGFLLCLLTGRPEVDRYVGVDGDLDEVSSPSLVMMPSTGWR